jgi:hypothetical protein
MKYTPVTRCVHVCSPNVGASHEYDPVLVTQISSRQARAFKNTFASVRYAGNTGMRTNNRPIQMLNNRTIMYAVDNFQSGSAGV